jgi:hypothetical protein
MNYKTSEQLANVQRQVITVVRRGDERIFRTGGLPGPRSHVTKQQWQCVDEEGRNCTLELEAQCGPFLFFYFVGPGTSSTLFHVRWRPRSLTDTDAGRR